MNVYDFKVKAQDGTDVSLDIFKGKVLLIVNTATDCGFTSQYKGLQEMYSELHEKGFEILDFPCNQFAEQAPDSDAEIHSFCSGRYGITFPQYSKIEVIGENAIPLYKWLSENSKFNGFSGTRGMLLKTIVRRMDKKYSTNGNIKWNFTKFVIDRNGQIAARFEPTEPLEQVKAKILEELNIQAY